MTNLNEFLYGFYYGQVAKRTSAGLLAGQATDPETLADGALLDSLLLRNTTEFVPPQPTFTEVLDQGGQKVRSKAIVGVEDIAAGTLSLSELNDIFTTMMNNTVIDIATVSGWTQIAENLGNTIFPPMFAVFTTRVQEIDDATGAIVDKFKTWILPNMQITKTQNPTATQAGGTNPQTPQFQMVVRASATRITGDTFNDAGMLVEDDTDFLYSIRSSNALMFGAYIEKATPDGSFTLPFLPLTDETITNDKLFYNGTTGASITPTTVTVATGAVVLPVQAASDHVIFAVETKFRLP